MKAELTIRRNASFWWVVVQAISGLALIFGGLITDRLSSLIVGVWLVLQAQLHLIIDEQRERAS